MSGPGGQPDFVGLPQLSDDELAELEAAVQIALRERDTASLNILGYGELSIVLGYPFDSPRYACKPSAPYTEQELDAYTRILDDYIRELIDHGLTVVPTKLMQIERGDRFVAYQVQPVLPAETIGDRVLRAAEPDPEHPLLVALAGMIASVTDRVSFDPQLPNWSWDGECPTLIDVGTPFFWRADGEPEMDMKPCSGQYRHPFERSLSRTRRRFSLATRSLAMLRSTSSPRSCVSNSTTGSILRSPP